MWDTQTQLHKRRPFRKLPPLRQLLSFIPLLFDIDGARCGYLHVWKNDFFLLLLLLQALPFPLCVRWVDRATFGGDLHQGGQQQDREEEPRNTSRQLQRSESNTRHFPPLAVPGWPSNGSSGHPEGREGCDMHWGTGREGAGTTPLAVPGLPGIPSRDSRAHSRAHPEELSGRGMHWVSGRYGARAAGAGGPSLPAHEPLVPAGATGVPMPLADGSAAPREFGTTNGSAAGSGLSHVLALAGIVGASGTGGVGEKRPAGSDGSATLRSPQEERQKQPRASGEENKTCHGCRTNSPTGGDKWHCLGAEHCKYWLCKNCMGKWTEASGEGPITFYCCHHDGADHCPCKRR